MKRGEAPKPLKYGPSAKLAHDPQVRKWVKRMLADPSATPEMLSEEQLVFVMTEVLKRRGDEFDQTLFQRAMAETCPVLSAPKITEPAADLRLIFGLPEMREMWRTWTGPVGARGPTPNYAGAKAAMVVMGLAGNSPHLDDVHHQLTAAKWFQDVFEDLERNVATERELEAGEQAPTFTDDDQLFAAGGYSTLARLIPRVAEDLPTLAMATNIALVRSLRDLFPNAGIGKRLLIDGSMVPAWCRQQGAGKNDPEREAKLREHTPEAGFRAYVQTGTSKRPIKPGDKLASGLRAGRGKAWRGYTLIVIADQATGLPLVWTLQDAALDEAAAIVPLLSDLHKFWPDIDAECIAGDSAWDEDAWCRLCEVDYGIHPIFRLHGKKVTKSVQDKESRDGSVIAYTHDGRLVCAEHQQPMGYAGADCPSRDKLKPGQSNDDGKFRVRGLCDHDGPDQTSKPGLRMKTDWSKLTFYPHHLHGNPRRYATRQAMLARLNQVEGLFNRVKAGRKLATPGADRNRLRDKQTVDGLLSLALLSFTALTVVDQRDRRAPSSNDLPPAPPRTGPRRAPKQGTAARVLGGQSRRSAPAAVIERPRPRPGTGMAGPITSSSSVKTRAVFSRSW